MENYDGKDIVLNQELNIILPVEENPELLEYEGKKLIVTDGTTLLGADDKAGVAEIMTMAQTLLAHPEKEHGTIRIAFTPDEEVGRGVDHFDVEGFQADYAYTCLLYTSRHSYPQQSFSVLHILQRRPLFPFQSDPYISLTFRLTG